MDAPSATTESGFQQLLNELNQLLWRQRNVLTDFLYRLEVQQLLLADGRDRWADRAVEDLQRAVDRVGRHEEMQKALLDELSAHMDVRAGSPLSDVAAVAPSPWNEIFEEHRGGFLVLINEIESAASENEHLIRQSLNQVGDLLGRIGDHSGGRSTIESYGPSSRGPRRPTGAMLLDREV